MPWFRRFDVDRVIISMINRMMANHSCLRSHLGRLGIMESPICVCSRDYETVDHELWGCERFDNERPQLWIDLRLTDTEWGTPTRDILGGRDWRTLRRCCSFYIMIMLCSCGLTSGKTESQVAGIRGGLVHKNPVM
jgi:hypothetical protein